MDNLMMQKILMNDYKKYKSFLDKNRFTLDPDWEDYHQLNNALRCEQKELVKLLISGGARVNKSLKFKEFARTPTPLHLAVNLGSPEIIKMLLDKGASINVKDRNDETPLMVAAKTRKNHIIDLMLSVEDQKNCLNKENLAHLHIACMRNQVDVVKKLIQRGAKIKNAVKEKSLYWPGFTALHFAVEFKCYETAELLLNCGADIVAKDAAGLTPLHRAHMLRDEPMIDLILSFHACKLMNPVDPYGLSHFHIACTRNNPRVVENFIEWGADVNKKVSMESLNWSYCAPIDFAVEFACVDVVRLLLAYDVSLLLTISELNPIQYAFKMANNEITDLLVFKSNIQNTDVFTFTQEERDSSIEDKLLVLHTATPSIYLQCSPLHLAIKNECPKATKVLLAWDKNYAVTKSACMKNKTPLHLAFESQQTDVVDLILSTLKADENPSDDDGLSHFHIACARNKIEIVEKFLEHRVDVNAQVRRDSTVWPGYTALHFAVQFNALGLVEFLMKRGADVNLKNGNDLTPFDSAVFSRDLSEMNAILSLAVSLDISMDARSFTLLHVASAKNDVPTMEQLLNLHPDLINEPINCPASEWHGYTPLHFAMHFGRREAADLLVLRGANISAKNADNNTVLHTAYDHDYERRMWNLSNEWFLTEDNPVGDRGFSHFHYACAKGNLEAVQHFLNLGVDIHQPTYLTEKHEYDGWTPLHVACSGYGPKLSVVQLLLDRGAELNAQDALLNTPLHLTYRSGTVEATRFLLSLGADVTTRNMYGMTPLLAICNGYEIEDESFYGKIEVLCEYGADINDVDDDGRTAITGWTDLIDSFPSTLAVMMKHIKKLQLIGHYISEVNEQEYDVLLRSTDLQGFYDERVHAQQCRKELERMENIKIDVYTTLRDILNKDPNDLALHSENSSLRNRIESTESLKQEFPLYGYLLRLQFNKGLERRPLLEKAGAALNWLIGSSSSMPVDCLERILRSATNEDLRNVIDATKAI